MVKTPTLGLYYDCCSSNNQILWMYKIRISAAQAIEVLQKLRKLQL